MSDTQMIIGVPLGSPFPSFGGQWKSLVERLSYIFLNKARLSGTQIPQECWSGSCHRNDKHPSMNLHLRVRFLWNLV